MKVFTPPNLDLEALLEEHPPNFEFEYDIDDFKYIISTIISIKALYKDYHDDEFVPVNAQALQSRVREYHHYIDYLLEHGIIEVKNGGQFFIGVKSRCYKLCDKYMKNEFELVEVTNPSLVNKRKKHSEAERILTKEYNYLTKWFNEKLQINEQRANEMLMHLLFTEHADGDIHRKVKGKASPWEKYLYRSNSLKMLQSGMYHMSIDNNVKRFHSNLTNLKSELRQFITYDGKRLCGVDVKNCQPFISTVLFNPTFYEKKRGAINLFTLTPTIYKTISPLIPSILSTIPTITTIITLVKEGEIQCSSDIELYCTLVDKGRFYRYFSERYYDKTGIKLDVALPEEKRKLKDGLFTTFFSDNRFIGQPEAAMKRLFADVFPDVYRVFSLIKKGGHKAHLPVILQLYRRSE